MSLSAKTSIIAWWILIFIALLIWYRNVGYDRVMAGIFVVLGLIHLIEYGCHSALKPKVSGNLIIISLTILLIVVTFGVYLYTDNIIALIASMIAVGLMITVIFGIMCDEGLYRCSVNEIGTSPSWTYNGDDMLGGSIFIFAACIIVSWICMLTYTEFQDIGLYIIAGYVFFSLLYCSSYYSCDKIGSTWCYMLTGLALIVWVIGLFKQI